MHSTGNVLPWITEHSPFPNDLTSEWWNQITRHAFINTAFAMPRAAAVSLLALNHSIGGAAQMRYYRTSDPSDVRQAIFNLQRYDSGGNIAVEVYEVTRNINRAFAIPDESEITLQDVSTKFTQRFMQDRYHKFRIFQNGRNFVVLTNNTLQSNTLELFVALLPKYLELEDSPTTKLARSLADETAWFEAFTEYFEPFAETLANAQNEKLKAQFQISYASNIETAQHRVRQWRQEIDRYLESTRQMQARIDEENIRIYGYQTAPQENGDEAFEYYRNHPYVKAMREEDGALVLDIITPLRYYDSDFITNYLQRQVLPDDTERLLTAVFITELVEVNIAASVKVKFNEHRVCSSRSSATRRDAITNSHIMNYDCFGSNLSLIQEALNSKDYIGALEQIIASVAGVNATDTTVWPRIIDQFRCIVQGETTHVTLRNKTTGDPITLEEALAL